MNKQQLINQISRQHGHTKAETQRILNSILQTIKIELVKGHLLRLRNFGTFRVRKSRGQRRAKFDPSKNFFKLQ